MASHVGGQVLGRGLAGGQARDREDRDSGLDLNLLVRAAAFAAFTHGAGGVALDQEHLRRVGKAQVGGASMT